MDVEGSEGGNVQESLWEDVAISCCHAEVGMQIR